MGRCPTRSSTARVGSGSIVSQPREHGPIGEYQLVVNPVLLGSGKRLFGGAFERTRLEQLDAKRFPSGNVMLRYAPESEVR